MKLIKVALAIVLVGSLAAGGLYVAENRGLVPSGTFASVLQRAPKNVNVGSLQSTVNSLAAQSSQLASQSGVVLGASVGIEKESSPISQRAFEFARYNYCQQVVKDYQARQSLKE